MLDGQGGTWRLEVGGAQPDGSLWTDSNLCSVWFFYRDFCALLTPPHPSPTLPVSIAHPEHTRTYTLTQTRGDAWIKTLTIIIIAMARSVCKHYEVMISWHVRLFTDQHCVFPLWASTLTAAGEETSDIISSLPNDSRCIRVTVCKMNQPTHELSIRRLVGPIKLSPSVCLLLPVNMRDDEPERKLHPRQSHQYLHLSSSCRLC